MASKATICWRSLLTRNGAPNRRFATMAAPSNSHRSRSAHLVELAPIGALAGMLSVAFYLGIHTAKQQLVHSPSVRVDKRKRQNIPELVEPNSVKNSASKFIDKSRLRYIAQIQYDRRTLKDPIRPDPYTLPVKRQDP